PTRGSAADRGVRPTYQKDYPILSVGESDMTSLADRHCVPCRGGVPPLEGEALEKLSAQLPDWMVIDGHHIKKTFLFPDFKTALDFVNRVGAVAEAERHHPDLCLAG